MTTYITTTIPYVNAEPHIGFALELAQADAFARAKRLLGEDVLLQTGTDDNALKNVDAADRAGISVEEFVDTNAAAFRRLADRLLVDYSTFIRTSSPQHKQQVHAFLNRINPSDLYRGRYTGKYCVGCADYIRSAILVNGRCPDHDTEPEDLFEENVFFRLSGYEAQLLDLIESNRIQVWPESRRAEVLSFIRSGLHDIAVSRSSARFRGWGTPFPGDNTQVVYVWIDALINYLSGLANWELWTVARPRVHVIGKNVWKFHAVYWPALLLSAGLPVPDRVYVHGFLTVEGRKIGKSLGNCIDPQPLISAYGADALRYTLLRLHPFRDSDFTVQRFKEVYSSELSNSLGNLFSRYSALVQRAGISIRESTPELPPCYSALVDDYRFPAILDYFQCEVRSINKEIDNTRVWRWFDDPDLVDDLHQHLQRWGQQIVSLAHGLSPFLPKTCAVITSKIKGRITKSERLFPKLQD